MLYKITDKEFGIIKLNLRRGMKNIIFRWKNDQLHIIAPIEATPENLHKSIDDNRPRIRACKADGIRFYEGQVIPLFRSSLTIKLDPSLDKYLVWGRDKSVPNHFIVSVPTRVDLNDIAVKKTISKVISDVCKRYAPEFLLPFARQEAVRVGHIPKSFDISHGKRRLGYCTAQGDVKISHFLMLLDEEMVRCVICHELAHLVHLNHSPAFYSTLNQFLNGRQKELDFEINHFRWPIYT